jgi:formylglycine-generating enzyme required for sulfatase activity
VKARTLRPPDQGWGRARQPVINVEWNDAKAYAGWLAKKTGRPYRLLSEAEYEYAARAGTQTAYPWGNNIGKNNANCDGCGSQWDNKQTAPVGSFAPNQFGLYDMAGNVWVWTEDCLNFGYKGAPTDGSPWTSGDYSRMLRGGSWNYSPDTLVSTFRLGGPARGMGSGGTSNFGFRVARTLVVP